MGTIIFVTIVIIIVLLFEKLDIELSWVLKHKVLSVCIFVAISLLIIIYLNRYSLISFYLLMHWNVPFWESVQKSFSVSNDISMALGIFEEIAKMKFGTIPNDISKIINDLKEGINSSYGQMGTMGDLFSIFFKLL